jgi:hypothetical protein
MAKCPFKDELAEMRNNLVPEILTVCLQNDQDRDVVLKYHPTIAIKENSKDLCIKVEDLPGFFGQRCCYLDCLNNDDEYGSSDEEEESKDL